MTNIKDDLDQYLLLQNEQKKKFNIKIPELGQVFSRKQDTEVNGWLKDTQDCFCPKLSRLQRIIGFVTFLGLGTFCITLSLFYVPVLLLKPRKFAMLYTLGSLFFILSFCFLSGFVAFFKTLCTKQRSPIAVAYFGSLLITLYCSLWIQSTPLTVLFSLIQMMASAFMIIGTIPGGLSGIQFFGSLFKSTVTSSTSSVLPV